MSWSLIEAEAQHAFLGEGRFRLPAYSELMPPPHVGIKPYDPRRACAAATAGIGDDGTLDITEYEQAQELGPGLVKIAARIARQLRRLAGGEEHDLSRTLLDGNPAWPGALSDAAAAGRMSGRTITLATSLALSRTQDDKGNVRWSLFGCSHEGAGAAFWGSFRDDDGDRLARTLSWLSGTPDVRIFAPDTVLPRCARDLALGDALPAAVVTFVPFTALPGPVQAAYLEGKLDRGCSTARATARRRPCSTTTRGGRAARPATTCATCSSWPATSGRSRHRWRARRSRSPPRPSSASGSTGCRRGPAIPTVAPGRPARSGR